MGGVMCRDLKIGMLENLHIGFSNGNHGLFLYFKIDVNAN